MTHANIFLWSVIMLFPTGAGAFGPPVVKKVGEASATIAYATRKSFHGPTGSSQKGSRRA